MTPIIDIAGAMEAYGESAVAEIILRLGNPQDILASFDIEAELRLQKMARYETNDGLSFKRKT
jgi:hypothetical protein